MAIPITQGSGAASVASEQIGTANYQQIKVVGGETGSTSVLGVTPDNAMKVSVIGTPTVDIGVIPGSVAAFQAGTWRTSVVNIVPSSVIFGASIFGLPPVNVTNTNLNVSGSVAAWLNSSAASVITLVQGSVAVAFAASANQSVSGTVGASIIGMPNPLVITGSVQGSFSPSGNQSVSGTVDAAQISTWRVSVIGSVPSSLLAGASIFGQLPAGTAPLGSVATLQGTNPWVVTNVGSIVSLNVGSVITTNVGSVITVLQAASIVGTYAEDAAHATGDKGILKLMVRNDTMASITSTDGDYSPDTVGPAGETIVANAPITKWVQGTADIRGAGTTGSSVVVIAAQGASIFTYITGLQVANMGSASVLVTLSGATSSIIGYTIAPAGGGSNIVFGRNALKTNANGAFTASISGVASVLVSAQGFIAKI